MVDVGSSLITEVLMETSSVQSREISNLIVNDVL